MTVHSVFAEAEVSVTNAESFEDDAVEEISDQMLVISKESWNNREINLLGRGSRNLLLYGNTRAGALNNVTLSGSKTPIYIFGGYYDGSLEQGEIVDVTSNVVNVNDCNDDWIFLSRGILMTLTTDCIFMTCRTAI